MQPGKWKPVQVFQTEVIQYRVLVTWLMHGLRNYTGGEITQELAMALPPLLLEVYQE